LTVSRFERRISAVWYVKAVFSRNLLPLQPALPYKIPKAETPRIIHSTKESDDLFYTYPNDQGNPDNLSFKV
jgi:hypothetical protein